jgi:hypothetical protein
MLTLYESGRVAHGATGGGTFFAEDDEKLRVFQSPSSAKDWTELANAATTTIREIEALAPLWPRVSTLRSSRFSRLPRGSSC